MEMEFWQASFHRRGAPRRAEPNLEPRVHHLHVIHSAFPEARGGESFGSGAALEQNRHNPIKLCSCVCVFETADCDCICNQPHYQWARLTAARLKIQPFPVLRTASRTLHQARTINTSPNPPVRDSHAVMTSKTTEAHTGRLSLPPPPSAASPTMTAPTMTTRPPPSSATSPSATTPPTAPPSTHTASPSDGHTTDHDHTPSCLNLNTTSDLEKSPTLLTLDLETLGRRRPPVFTTALREVIFCSSLLVSMLMAEFFISGFNIILPDVSRALSIPSGSQTWPASVFSLVTGAFLLPLGRVADIYGAYWVFTGGLVWFCMWNLVCGFVGDYRVLIVARALGGLGPAAFLPSTVMLVGKTYRPGPRKNLVFGLYCAFAPIGFFLGIIVGGTVTQLLTWRWYFWLGSVVLGLTCVMGFLTVPNDCEETRRENKGIRMDWWGVGTIVPGLMLLNFAITDGAHAPLGWKTPYIIATAVVGVVFLGAAFYVEGWVAEQPLLPFDLFQPKYMGRLTVSLFFAYGVFGIFLFYASLQ